MEPSRKITKRYRSQDAINFPCVRIEPIDIVSTEELEGPQDGRISSALEITIDLWKKGNVDYLAANPVCANSVDKYLIYTPEQGVGGDDMGVEEFVRFSIDDEYTEKIVGVFIDIVRCKEDPYDLHIAKIIIR